MTATSILPGFDELVKPFKFPATPHEFKVTALKECPTPENLQMCDTADSVCRICDLVAEANASYYRSADGH